MTVRDLIEILETYDDDTEVVIGMQQTYGTDFAMRIRDVEEHNIMAFYGKDYKAVVITEGSQCGAVDYDEEHDDWED
jgi:hypothetical protein